MDKSSFTRIVTFLLLSSASNFTIADNQSDTFSEFELKPFGVTLEWSQHELALDVLEITTDIPGVTQQQLDAIKGQLNANSQSESINLKLDYQITPNVNVYGALGKVTDTTEVDLSSVLPGVANFISDHDGNVYTVGATLTGKYGSWVPSLNATHSRIDLENDSEQTKVNTFTSSLGRITPYGLFSGSLLYQSVEADYAETANVPFLGDVPVVVSTENKDKWRLMVGWSGLLGKDLFINTNVSLSDDKQFHIQLNKRF